MFLCRVCASFLPVLPELDVFHMRSVYSVYIDFLLSWLCAMLAVRPSRALSCGAACSPCFNYICFISIV